MTNVGYNLVEKHNPFLFFEPLGTEPMDFRDYLECYEYTLTEIYKSSRKGFFDVALFLCIHTRQKLSKAVRFIRVHETLCDIQPYEFMLIDWNGGEGRNKQLISILQLFHQLTGTNLNRDMALEAVRLLDMTIEYLNTKNDEQV